MNDLKEALELLIKVSKNKNVGIGMLVAY